MPCNLTRRDVSRIVLGVIRHIQNDQTIVEASVFGSQGINADPTFRTTYFGPIRKAVLAANGCATQRFSSADCSRAESVAEIVDAVFDDLQSQQEPVG
jgi:hypothetical protein